MSNFKLFHALLLFIDDPKDCEIVDCTIDWVVNLCPKTCALKPKKLNRCEEDICNCVDCSKPRSSQVCPLACPASTKGDHFCRTTNV